MVKSSGPGRYTPSGPSPGMGSRKDADVTERGGKQPPNPPPPPVASKEVPEPPAGSGGFVTKDSGERVDFPSGMRRDTTKGKTRFDLIPIPMLRRLADLYARGAEKYGDENWTLADSDVELRRFKASAFRHFMDWMEGNETGEDEAAASCWNIFAYETISAKIKA